MQHSFIVGLCAALSLTMVPATAQAPIPAADTSVTAGEKAIATYLVQDSIGDVQLGQLGVRNAQSAAVRKFARAMVRDHTRTAERGMAVAQKLGADEAKPVAESSNQVDLSRLARYNGATFDREYLKTLIDAHKSDITLIQDALTFTSDATLRAALTNVLAVDRMHLEMALAARRAIAP